MPVSNASSNKIVEGTICNLKTRPSFQSHDSQSVSTWESDDEVLTSNMLSVTSTFLL